MIKHLVSVTFTILFLVDFIFPVQAGAEPSCLVKASQKIKPNSAITLIKTDQSKISGQLLSIDLDRLSLGLIQTRDSKAGSHSTYEISEIAKIQYHGYGKMKPGVILPFTILGAVVGGAIGGTRVGLCKVFVCKDYTAEGAAIGGVAGFLIGTIISIATKSTFTIECK